MDYADDTPGIFYYLDEVRQLVLDGSRCVLTADSR